MVISPEEFQTALNESYLRGFNDAINVLQEAAIKLEIERHKSKNSEDVIDRTLPAGIITPAAEQ